LKFKFELELNDFANYKGFQKLETNFFSLFGFGPNPSLIPESGPADSPLPSLLRGPMKANVWPMLAGQDVVAVTMKGRPKPTQYHRHGKNLPLTSYLQLIGFRS
jgi:hypothetical protein